MVFVRTRERAQRIEDSVYFAVIGFFLSNLGLNNFGYLSTLTNVKFPDFYELLNPVHTYLIKPKTIKAFTQNIKLLHNITKTKKLELYAFFFLVETKFCFFVFSVRSVFSFHINYVL